MSIAPLLVLSAEAESSGVNPWLAGAVTLALLTLLIVGLLAFGAGRDHS